MRALASHLETASPVQRSCAVLYAYQSNMLRSTGAMRAAMALATVRHGERRGLAVMAANLSRQPEVLEPLWRALLVCLASGQPDGDGVSSAKVDADSIGEMVGFLRRLGWQPQPVHAPPPRAMISGRSMR